MIDGVDPEEWEMWKSMSVTERVVKELRRRRRIRGDQVIGAAWNGGPEAQVRAGAGRIAGFDEVLEMLDAKETR